MEKSPSRAERETDRQREQVQAFRAQAATGCVNDTGDATLTEVDAALRLSSPRPPELPRGQAHQPCSSPPLPPSPTKQTLSQHPGLPTLSFNFYLTHGCITFLDIHLKRHEGIGIG
jgi:hypothetical protein